MNVIEPNRLAMVLQVQKWIHCSLVRGDLSAPSRRPRPDLRLLNPLRVRAATQDASMTVSEPSIWPCTCTFLFAAAGDPKLTCGRSVSLRNSMMNRSQTPEYVTSEVPVGTSRKAMEQSRPLLWSSSTRFQFITAIPLNVWEGSGCYMGIRTLEEGIRALGGEVNFVTPGRFIFLFTRPGGCCSMRSSDIGHSRVPILSSDLTRTAIRSPVAIGVGMLRPSKVLSQTCCPMRQDRHESAWLSRRVLKSCTR